MCFSIDRENITPNPQKCSNNKKTLGKIPLYNKNTSAFNKSHVYLRTNHKTVIGFSIGILKILFRNWGLS